MKLNYQYRWWYGLSLFFVLFVIEWEFILAGEYSAYVASTSQYSNIKQRYIQAIRQTKSNRRKQKQLTIPLVQHEMLNAILRLCWSSDLQVQSVSQSNENDGEHVLIALHLNGAYDQLINWLYRLTFYSPLHIQSLKIEDKPAIDNKMLSITITLLLGRVTNNVTSAPAMTATGMRHNPFCLSRSPQANIPFVLNTDELIKLPIEDFKMIGMVAKGKRKQVIFSLPNGQFALSQIGAIISSRHAKITNIHPLHVSLQMADGHIIQIKARNANED